MRDLKKEAAWEKQKYHRLQYRCPVDVHKLLDAKLKSDGVTFSAWIKAKISEYINGRR